MALIPENVPRRDFSFQSNFQENYQESAANRFQSGTSKPRKTISTHQKNLLNMEFERSKYISMQACSVLSEKTGLNTKTIQTWFRNKRFRERMKLKKKRLVGVTTQGSEVHNNNEQIFSAETTTAYPSTSYTWGIVPNYNYPTMVGYRNMGFGPESQPIDSLQTLYQENSYSIRDQCRTLEDGMNFSNAQAEI